VERNAAHGRAAAFGQGNVENGGGGLRVLEEHFVEIAESVEENDVSRQAFPHREVLGHHGCGCGHGGMLGIKFQISNFKFQNRKKSLGLEGEFSRKGAKTQSFGDRLQSSLPSRLSGFTRESMNFIFKSSTECHNSSHGQMY